MTLPHIRVQIAVKEHLFMTLRSLKPLLRLVLCACLLSSLSPPPVARAQNAHVTINVDAAANRRPINPNVYGVAHANAAQLNELNSPLNRHGGNNFAQVATVAAGVVAFSNTGLNKNTSYTYRVRAYNAAGDSAYSNTAG